MARRTAIVTGSSGLIGSEAAAFFDARGWEVRGVDNNMRRNFFGPHGDTSANLERLRAETSRYVHHDLDVRDRAGLDRLVAEQCPALIVHAAAQPSHDLAAARPFDDFEVNATGTLNLLEAARRHTPETPFVFLSTNKVYGDAPNELPLVELETRWDYADPQQREGIDESMRIDATMHSLFGASKAAADLLVQEYGRYFGLPTVCFRGGCLTGSRHAGAELHGFLAYLARAVRDGLTYRIFGYKGKQVRDNLHSYDVCTAIAAFAERPASGAVYNLGGGRANSVSVLEAIARFEELFGRRLETEYVEEPRRGDHICYISDLRRLRADYPEWEPAVDLDAIFAELAGHAVPALVP
jgi:CDP-paratose 2-epimerase